MGLQTTELSRPSTPVVVVVTADFQCLDLTMTELVGKTSDRLTAGWALVGSMLFPVQACLAVELCTALDLLWVLGNTMAYQAGEFAWWCVLESTVISTGIGGHQNLPCKR